MIELPVLNSTASADASPRKRFWRSVQHLEADPGYSAFTESELMTGAQGSPGDSSRRQFLQLMGASMALAGLTACRKPVEHIMPFVRKPEDMVPGVPLQYATGMEFRGALRPLVVESTDGRPTKVEGNPEHPESNGSSGIFEQASLLALYDPDRSQQVLRNGDGSTWADFVRFVAERDPGRTAVVLHPTASPTVERLAAALAARNAGSRVVVYDESLAAADASRVRYHFDRARVILSLGRDFLGSTDVDHLHNTATFARSRAADDGSTMSRLYVIEAGYSITGGAADHRLALKPSQIAAFGAAVARKLGADAPASTFDDHPWAAAIAEDLRGAGSAAVVVADPTHAAAPVAAAINAALGSWGTTAERFVSGPLTATSGLEGLAALASDCAAGRFDTLLLVGVNPVYDLPASVDFAGAMGKVAETVHVGLHVDETAVKASWHVPMAHYLESWGDGRSFGGTLSVTQPLIAPLYDAAHSAIEVLSLFATGTDRSGYDLVRESWSGVLTGDFEKAWRRVIHDGFLPGTAYASSAPPAVAVPAVTSGPDGIEVLVQPDPTVFDGSFANLSWLQELPDPVTKVVWDNVAAVSPATAARLGLSVELDAGQHFVDRIAVTLGSSTVDLPVWPVPGMADDVVQVNLGYGRSIVSRRPERTSPFWDTDSVTDVYGTGAVAAGVGVSVSDLRGAAGAASITRSGSGYLVATTQDHGALPDEGAEAMDRGLVRMATLDVYRQNPEFVRAGDPRPIREEWTDYPALWQSRHPADEPAIKDSPYFRNQWGMVIDLNACTGCNACTIACQAENNIQVVGKDQVSRGREMHWIRLDRYFVGDGADAPVQMVVQPLPCQHCENAPCESVCPVAATVHSPDGTNQMVYNRCIGTRYCANNCPYKVRRFNFYNWTKTLPASLNLAHNPNVTVRSRGVMEKCSFCIQRVREVNKRVNVENRSIRDGEVKTACQQACPASAITFGDLNDTESAVSKAKRNPRRYEILAELSVKPRTSYLGRIRNPNPQLEAGV